MTNGEAEAKVASIFHAAFRALRAGEPDAGEKAAQAVVAHIRPRGGWRPFSTAPARTMIVAADHGREYWAIGCINAAGEFEQVDRIGSPLGIGFYPTHWMPLPPPPVRGVSAEGTEAAPPVR